MVLKTNKFSIKLEKIFKIYFNKGIKIDKYLVLVNQISLNIFFST